jgi:hypothetical protein
MEPTLIAMDFEGMLEAGSLYGNNSCAVKKQQWIIKRNRKQKVFIRKRRKKPLLNNRGLHFK